MSRLSQILSQVTQALKSIFDDSRSSRWGSYFVSMGALRPASELTLACRDLHQYLVRLGLKNENIRIRVSATRPGELLCLEVEDTGLGLPPADTHRPGFGLQQVRERLSTTFGALGTIKIGAASAEGTRVSITFPLKP